MTTTDVKDIDGAFFCKVTGFEYCKKLFYTKLPLNEDNNNFQELQNDINYKKTIRKLHDSGWENSYFTSTDVSMLDYGCGVSKYHQFMIRIQIFIKCHNVYIGVFLGFSLRQVCKRNMGVRLDISS